MSLGDPHFVNVTGPVSALLSDAYTAALQSTIQQSNVLPLGTYGGRYNMSYAQNLDFGTTHLSVVDKWGNAGNRFKTYIYM